MEFIYWPHPTPAGIKVEEVTGMLSKSGRLWESMALQIYCENGRDGYRDVGHFPSGAPFLFGSPCRISITHTDHFLAVASLPKTPEADLARFSPRSALGIDAESLGRTQVLKVRERFLSPDELAMIPEDDLEANIIAWTAKEALYKAALYEGLDLREGIILRKLPHIDRKMNLPGAPAPVYGQALLRLPDGDVDMELYSYESEGETAEAKTAETTNPAEPTRYCVTMAYSPKCAKFSRPTPKNP